MFLVTFYTRNQDLLTSSIVGVVGLIGNILIGIDVKKRL